MLKKSMIALLMSILLILLVGCGANQPNGHNNSNSAANAKDTNSAEAPNESETADSEAQQEEKIEGTLNFYTSQPDADAAKLVEAFNAKYPDVKVSIFRSGTEEVISKIQAEKLAGSIQADLLLVADAVTFEILKEQDLLMSYQSKELKGIPAEYADPDYTYTGTKIIATALAVNTDIVKEIPESWNVLISESAKGQAMMPGPLYSGAAAYNVGVFTRTEGFGWDFFEGLKANDMVVAKGNGGVLKAVAGGEKAYAMVVDFLVARAEQEGSPVKLIYPKEGVPAITEPVGILKNTRNAAAAKAFVDFILSEEGQKMQSELGYTPIRSGISAPAGLMGIDEMNVLSADINELYKNREQDKEHFTTVFGE
ncbi:ABC transporter substrate-binding protein [Paenibacillus tarimensis]